MTIRQLVHVFAAIDQSSFEAELERRTFDIDTAVEAIAAERGWDFFRCEADTNLWLGINPASDKWQQMNRFTNEIALFSPFLISINGTNAPIAAMNFAGKGVRLPAPSEWKPLDLEKLADKNQAKQPQNF